MPSYAQAVSAPVTPVRNRQPGFSRTPSSTASTPYTLSSGGRSLASSTLTTPASLKLSFNSSDRPKATRGVADLTENWRVRAQLNGIKVSATEDENSKKAPLLSPGFAPSFRRKSSPFSSPSSAARSPRSAFTTPSSKTSDVKYTLGAFNTSQSRRRPLYDSPFSDITEDDAPSDRPSSAFLALRPLQDLSNLDSSPQSSPVRDGRSSCSVCDKEPTSSSRMIVLSPCSHIFCATCFTGTLNIVGEKNMSCMECQSSVDNFHFALGIPDVSTSGLTSDAAALLGNPFEESTSAPSVSKPASTPRNLRDKMAVLRIDNVPWDVTPLTIQKFIKHPIILAHVLLDPKGKTLSHAFVQLTPENARAALRSSQNAILGEGRRARAVTVTLSSEAELMASLYPHWRGSFDGYQPSLDNLDNHEVNDALQRGLISNAELNSLYNLLTTPDSHFLKVPSLPFFSLVSILSTFPSDVDSRVFWTGQLRDALFRVTLAGLQILASRKQSEEDLEAWKQLVTASTGCRAFTTAQVFKLQLVFDSTPLADPKAPVETLMANLRVESQEKFHTLAAQFGLEPNVLATILQSFV